MHVAAGVDGDEQGYQVATGFEESRSRRAGRRVAVTHTVVVPDILKTGREVLLTDNWVSANMPWAEWTGADYRHLSVANEAKGEAIRDSLNGTRGDGTEIWALTVRALGVRSFVAGVACLCRMNCAWVQ